MGMPTMQAAAAGTMTWSTNTPTTCGGVNPIAFMIPISRYPEMTMPVTRLATIAAVAASAKTLKAMRTLVSTCVETWKTLLMNM